MHPNYILIYRVKGEAVEIALSSTRGSAIRDPSAERALAGRHGVVQAIGGGAEHFVCGGGVLRGRIEVVLRFPIGVAGGEHPPTSGSEKQKSYRD